ncbi:MAG: flavodoxin family protein [Lachnospiraceae bacterium]|nr:flavodoxin family protein [Lachnospiraceae bacterium]
MGKKVFVITSSFRKGGNSDSLAEAFAKGARESGNEVEVIRLADKKIGFCKGCLTCIRTQKCVIDDDAVEIAEKMKDADVIAFATPIYYYSVCGQLKTMLDRANALYASEYKFRDIYLLASAAEEAEETVSGTQTAIQGWIDCFERAKLAGTVFAGGVNDKGDIAGHKALEEAYKAGREIR